MSVCLVSKALRLLLHQPTATPGPEQWRGAAPQAGAGRPGLPSHGRSPEAAASAGADAGEGLRLGRETSRDTGRQPGSRKGLASQPSQASGPGRVSLFITEACPLPHVGSQSFSGKTCALGLEILKAEPLLRNGGDPAHLAHYIRDVETLPQLEMGITR